MTRLSEILLVLLIVWFVLPILQELRVVLLEQIQSAFSYGNSSEMLLFSLAILVIGIVAVVKALNQK